MPDNNTMSNNNCNLNYDPCAKMDDPPMMPFSGGAGGFGGVGGFYGQHHPMIHHHIHHHYFHHGFYPQHPYQHY